MEKFLVLNKEFFKNVINFEAMFPSLPLSVTKNMFDRVVEEICNTTSGDMEHVLTCDDVRLLYYAAMGWIYSFADEEDRILFENPGLFVVEEEPGEDGRLWRYHVFSEDAQRRGRLLYEDFLKLF